MAYLLVCNELQHELHKQLGVRLQGQPDRLGARASQSYNSWTIFCLLQGNLSFIWIDIAGVNGTQMWVIENARKGVREKVVYLDAPAYVLL